jgi:hypothetical protein
MAADSLNSVSALPAAAEPFEPVSDFGSHAACSMADECSSRSDVITPPAFSIVDCDAGCESNADCCRLEFEVLRLRTIPFPRRHRRPFASLFDQASGFHSPKSLNAMSGPLKNSTASSCEIQNCCCQKEPAFAMYAVESARFQLVARGILGALDRSRIGSRCSLSSVCGIVPNRFATAGPRLRSAEQPTQEFRLRQPDNGEAHRAPVRRFRVEL